jgi:DNA modification methylase
MSEISRLGSETALKRIPRIDAAKFPAHTSMWMNQLYYGDNLQVLREHIADEFVDLNYLDPPFNSNEHLRKPNTMSGLPLYFTFTLLRNFEYSSDSAQPFK